MEAKFIYVLTKYEYDTYSYSGITPSEHFYHATKEGAEAHAAKLLLKIVQCPENHKEASLDREQLFD